MVFGHFAARRQDAYKAIATDKVEYILDGEFVGFAIEADFKTQIAGLGIHLPGKRNGVDDGHQLYDAAQRGQAAHERKRVHAVPEYVRTEAQGYMPKVGSDRFAFFPLQFDFVHYRHRSVGRGRRRIAQVSFQLLDQAFTVTVGFFGRMAALFNVAD